MIEHKAQLRSPKNRRDSCQTIFTKLLSSIDFKYERNGEHNIETSNLGVSMNINTKSKRYSKTIVKTTDIFIYNRL